MRIFQYTKASVPGTRHIQKMINNQDGLAYAETPDFAVAVVTDGCSAAKFAELGSNTGANLIASSMMTQFQYNPMASRPKFWLDVRADVVTTIRDLAEKFPGSLQDVVADYFLFSAVAVAITRDRLTFAYVGDGLIIVNGEIQVFEPYYREENMPAYMTFPLIKTARPFPEDTMRFKVMRSIPIADVDSFLIGTDGVNELIDKAEAFLPAEEEMVGPISQFWTQNRYYSNPDEAQIRLQQLNRAKTRADWKKQQLIKIPGLLSDDTTFIAGRFLEVDDAVLSE